MKKFSCSKIKYFPADSVEGAKIINNKSFQRIWIQNRYRLV